jgi:hypothetical protein
MPMPEQSVETYSGEMPTGSPVIRAAEKSVGRDILDTWAPHSNWANAPQRSRVKLSWFWFSWYALVLYVT